MLTDEYRYRMLKLLEANPQASQREFARELGISLGRGLPPGLIVQSLEILDFTGLERLGLARNVDFPVTDHAPYILSALSKNPTIISPVFHEKGRPIAGGSGQGMLFDISRLAESGRELERRRVTDDVPIPQGKSDSV